MPPADNAAPVGANCTCAVTGVDGSGNVAVPTDTVAQATHNTSMLSRSNGELKFTVRIGDADVMFVKLMLGVPPVIAVPPTLVIAAEQFEIFKPAGMLFRMI